MMPADTKVSDWLTWFTHEDTWRLCDRWFLLPDGRRAATDGKVAVATNMPAEDGSLPMNSPGKIPSALQEMMTCAALESRKMPYRSAVELFGPCEHQHAEECTACKGTGEVEHHCMCELCEAGTEECSECDNGICLDDPDQRRCSVLGVTVDANLVAYVFAHAPAVPDDDEVSIDALTSNRLRVVTSACSAVVCGLSGVYGKVLVQKERAS